MATNEKNESIEKFHALDKEKQKRILNAAMKEFAFGYKNASTDNMVKEAGISKGLLFHYFGTKERLYNYLIDYVIEIMQEEYLQPMCNVIQADVLESVWQLSLLKGELSLRYPAIFDFGANAYVDTTAPCGNIRLTRFGEVQVNLITQMYEKADYELFRDDIDSKKAIDIILWTIEGFANTVVAAIPGEGVGVKARNNYDKFLEEFQEIINILRCCFYKQK